MRVLTFDWLIQGLSHPEPQIPPQPLSLNPLMDSNGGCGASDLEIAGLMADAARLEWEAERAAHAARAARRSLALRAMSRTNSEERERIFTLGQPLTADLILAWASDGGSSGSINW